ncbi:MAG: class I SAM-dependent methyltransferase [Candidatus Electrothrix sp. AS4_5]|nr:class I SAM-dependent methyltransferase [Candidatus Electrothrix gigas]
MDDNTDFSNRSNLKRRDSCVQNFSLRYFHIEKKLRSESLGMGTDSLVLAQNGFNVTGVDITPAHLDLAKKLFNLYQTDGTFLEDNAEQLSFSDNSFSCVYSYGVLHHTPNTAKSIKEIYRVLRPKGHAVIMLYHKRSLNNFAHWVTGKGFENAKGDIDAPVTSRFKKDEVYNMCAAFNSCDIKIEYLFGAGWGKIYNIVPKHVYTMLSKLAGWHLVIYLQK